MTDHIVFRQIKFRAQKSRQLHQRIIGGVRKLSGLIRMTALDGDRVCVPAVGGVGDLARGDALDDLSLQADNKVAAHLGRVSVLQIFKIIPVLLSRATGVGGIMDHHAVDRAGGKAGP